LDNTLRNREDRLNAINARAETLQIAYDEERTKKLALEASVGQLKQLEDKKRQADTIIKNQGSELERLSRDLSSKVKECDDMRSRLSKQDQ
jgi:predicted RNase H-like nuclease (RuvC/YqgF family)